MTETREQVLAKQERAAARWREMQREKREGPEVEAARLEFAEAEAAYDERYPTRQSARRRRKAAQDLAPAIVEPELVEEEGDDDTPEQKREREPVTRFEAEVIVLVCLWVVMVCLYWGLRADGYIPVRDCVEITGECREMREAEAASRG